MDSAAFLTAYQAEFGKLTEDHGVDAFLDYVESEAIRADLMALAIDDLVRVGKHTPRSKPTLSQLNAAYSAVYQRQAGTEQPGHRLLPCPFCDSTGWAMVVLGWRSVTDYPGEPPEYCPRDELTWYPQMTTACSPCHCTRGKQVIAAEYRQTGRQTAVAQRLLHGIHDAQTYIWDADQEFGPAGLAAEMAELKQDLADLRELYDQVRRSAGLETAGRKLAVIAKNAEGVQRQLSRLETRRAALLAPADGPLSGLASELHDRLAIEEQLQAIRARRRQAARDPRKTDPRRAQAELRAATDGRVEVAG